MVPAWPGGGVPCSPQRGAPPVEAGQQTEALAVNIRPAVNIDLVNTGRVTIVCITVVVVVGPLVMMSTKFCCLVFEKNLECKGSISAC